MLTERQIELIEDTWDFALHNSREVGVIFYAKLFQIDPSLRTLFKGDINLQAQKLVDMITFIVHKLNTIDQIITDISELGLRHKNSGVQLDHYAMVATSLMWTLEQTIKQNWNEEVREAWHTAYNRLAEIMTQPLNH